MHIRRIKGFTIIELTVVIIVIGIIAAFTTLVYTRIQKEVRNDERTTQLTVLTTELEKFYDNKGEYPPGCPDTTCPHVMHTANTSSSALTPSTTLASLRQILPGIKDGFADPQSPNATLPFKNRAIAEMKYYYFGGTVNYSGAAATLDSTATPNFPCAIRSSLAAGQVGSYVVGYFDEITSAWILKGGRSGVPMTVTAGTCVIVRG